MLHACYMLFILCLSVKSSTELMSVCCFNHADSKESLFIYLLKDEVLLTVSSPIFSSILIGKNLLIGSLKNRSIDNLETQKKSISMKNSQFFDYLLYAKSK